MKRILSVVIVVLYTNSVFPQTFNQQIDSLINLVSLDSLVKHVRILSGEDSLVLKDSVYYIKTRASNAHFHETKGHRVAARYIVNYLNKYCSDVIEQTYVFRGVDTVRNIIGLQTGNTNPDSEIILSGHYDSITWDWDNSIAPGADDNASGTAAVLEAARILSQYDFNNTILYILWDWEEDGCFGSSYFSQEYENISNILYMLNFDMIGYSIQDTAWVNVYCGDEICLNSLGNALNNIINLYCLDITPILISAGGAGDCDAFWAENICPAVHVCEPYFGAGDYQNPYYHTVDDNIEYFNLNYFLTIVKLAVASTAELAINGLSSLNTDQSTRYIADFTLYQNYPNPFNSTTNISFSLLRDSKVKLKIISINGVTICTPISEYKSAGTYFFQFNASSLASGIYLYQIETNSFTQIKKMILLK